jgi:hypothetical protein
MSDKVLKANPAAPEPPTPEPKDDSLMQIVPPCFGEGLPGCFGDNFAWQRAGVEECEFCEWQNECAFGIEPCNFCDLKSKCKHDDEDLEYP